jgi:putative ABC transport system permease protein
MFWSSIRLALRSIRRNALRSVLTLLGIVIGVAAVIAMITMGNGTTQRVASDIARLGSNLLVVRPGQTFGPSAGTGESRPFHERDIAILRRELFGVKAVAPAAQKQVKAVFGAENWTAPITGADNEYFTAQDWAPAVGRIFNDGEIRAGAAACVIGETVRQELFGPQNPVGETLRLGKVSCPVIGLLPPKGSAGFGGDQDSTIIMPLRAFQRRIAGNDKITTIYLSATHAADTQKVQGQAEQLLREIRRIPPGRDDDFAVRDLKQIAETMAGTTAVMTGLLGAVAAVSLLVGGIGIMNIMLVSVTERTREIGIRLAIGAKETQVLTQFLIESMVLSLLGGIIGVVLGLGFAVAASYGLEIPFTPDLSVIALSFGFAGAVGVVFGFYPARRASKLDPIVALRHE